MLNIKHLIKKSIMGNKASGDLAMSVDCRPRLSEIL